MRISLEQLLSTEEQSIIKDELLPLADFEEILFSQEEAPKETQEPTPRVESPPPQPAQTPEALSLFWWASVQEQTIQPDEETTSPAAPLHQRPTPRTEEIVVPVVRSVAPDVSVPLELESETPDIEVEAPTPKNTSPKLETSQPAEKSNQTTETPQRTSEPSRVEILPEKVSDVPEKELFVETKVAKTFSVETKPVENKPKETSEPTRLPETPNTTTGFTPVERIHEEIKAAPIPRYEEVPTHQRVQVVIGEGEQQVKLSVSANEYQVKVVTQSAPPEMMKAMISSVSELQSSLQQHGLNLSHFGSNENRQKQPERDAEDETEKRPVASRNNRARVIL